MTHPTVFGGATPPPARYEIANSVRLRPGYFSRTASGGSTSKATISWWWKVCGIGTRRNVIGYADTGFTVELQNNDTMYLGGTAVTGSLQTSTVYRDPSAWYHFVLVYDTSQPAADICRFYCNGVRQTLTGTSPNGNPITELGAGTWEIGRRTDTLYAADGYIADYHHIDGQSLSPSSFGKLDTNGVWVPIRYAGTYGTNGCKLEFKNGASLGLDTSSNGNNWTVNGFTAADQMVDAPTNNYCTLLPFPAQMGSSVTMSNGNLTGTAAGDYTSEIIATQAIPSVGKWYFETSYTAGTASLHGVVKEGKFQGNYLNYSPGDVRESRGDNGQKSTYAYNNTTYGGSIGASGTMMCLVDMDNGKIYWGNAATSLWADGAGSFNQTWNSAVAAFSDLAGYSWLPRGRCYGGSLTFNFGQRPFIGTMPSGAKALCTANLPAVSVPDPAKHFNTVLYTGNGGTKAVTGMGFQPGFLWSKERSTSRSHFLQNEVVGPQSYLYTDGTGIEAFQHINGYVQSFDPDGFTLTAGSTSALTVNENNGAYVAWGWKGGGSATANTAGSIASSVSVNATAGLSVVTYTGTGITGTVGHGLGATPAFIISFSRNAANYDRLCYHQSLGPAKGIFLDLNIAAATNSLYWNNTAPTSTVITVGGTGNANISGSTNQLLYCFAEIPGFSKFGSYTGNDNPDGPFVHCGFRPRYVLLKPADVSGGWLIYDSVRDTTNPLDALLQANLPNAESFTTDLIDVVANGFKLRATGGGFNDDNARIIFAAFAEHPFGGTNVAPSPAR